MKITKSLYAVAFVALTLLSVSAHAARAVPVTDQTNAVPNVGSKPLSITDVKKAVMKAALSRGWQITNDSPGKLRLRLDDNRKAAYHVVIDVLYTTQSYTLKYVSSDGLRYDEGAKTIHSSYSRWMNMLTKSINKELISAS